MLMEFMIIINVSQLADLNEGLVLPKIMANQLPTKCEVIKLVDYTGFKYKISVQSIGHKSKRINGPEWTRFVETYRNNKIDKLYLKKLKEAKFELKVLNNEGLEIRKMARIELCSWMLDTG
ncbi:putative transcription factor B3-Domain family [Helianthus annuus]|nr:putative transcription factor B3-Domain family [Helianthus annuus]